MAANRWLCKEEPTHYSFDEFTKDGRTSWTGVRNPLAQRHLRSIAKGDLIFYYHTGDEKAVVGVMQAEGNAYPDPKDKSGRLYAVDVTPVRKLVRPVTLKAIKADPRFADVALVRMSRLSVMPVTEAQWSAIERMGS